MSKKAVVTGHRGLVGYSCVKALLIHGYEVHGIDNNIRGQLFDDAPSFIKHGRLVDNDSLFEYDFDLRSKQQVDEFFKNLAINGIDLVVHCAAQPSHDWATNNPHTDFELNTTATLNICEAIRNFSSETLLIFLSTNKVYGDTPNRLPLTEGTIRYEIETSHKFYQGIDESMSIDQTLHSLFGVSKTAADLYVQEYSRYFNIPAIILRGGCLTGAHHRGARQHGFMNYLIRCALNKTLYTIEGYNGKQVRDNLHSDDIGDLVVLAAQSHETKHIDYPVVSNLGGGRKNSVSILELISILSKSYGLDIPYEISAKNRKGDHVWYISDTGKLRNLFNWTPRRTLNDIIEETIKFVSI